MADVISLFPTLTDDLLGKIRFQKSEYEFYYFRDEYIYNLIAEEIDGNISLHAIKDEEGVWNPDDYNLCLKRRYSLRTCQCLFGENGIACNNAVIGMAIIWTSQDSKQRGVINVGEIQKSDKDLALKVEYEFPAAQLRGSVDFTTVLYIKQEGTPGWNEEHLANKYGCILGEIDKFTIAIDGKGSVFPIYEVDEPGQPLWYVKCDWDDPTYDLFSESVQINLNRAHKNFKYLDKTKRTYDNQLLIEVISSALSIVIMKLREQELYWDDTISGKGLQSGSVSEAVNYFKDVLEWDVTSPELISLSIRKFFDQRI